MMVWEPEDPPDRHEAIMLQKLSIMLLSSAPKIKKLPIIPKIMPLILVNNVNL